jgi:hypothetical protein
MSEHGYIEHPLDVWLVSSVRMTAFPTPHSARDKSNWWQDIMGELPEKQTAQPRREIFEEQGPFHGGVLTLKITPFRIDWTFMFTVGQVIEQSDASSPLSFPAVREKFIPLMTNWLTLDTCPTLQRLAFGAHLLQPVNELEDGYRRLAEYLHFVRLDPLPSSDFRYETNRRRMSTSRAELGINRLSKWSVMLIRNAQISLRELGERSMDVAGGGRAYFVGLELDINTMPEFDGELVRANTPNIWSELVGLGCEIVSQGDVP